jgi:hypothetical protein
MPFEFPALLLPHGTTHILVYGPEAESLGLEAPLFGPSVSLRPGYHLVAEPDYLLPNEVIDDIGQRWSAPFCYQWMEERGDLFPRADVIGQRASTGAAQSVFMKELDLVDLAVFAAPVGQVGNAPSTRIDLAIEARAVPDNYALFPTRFPIEVLDRGLVAYRLAPGVFGSVGAAILNQLILTKRADWRLTFDQLDEVLPD